MYMEFRELAVFDDEREVININRIRIYYNLKEIISGNIQKSLKEVRIIKSKFNFDYKKDYNLIKLFTNNSGNEITELNLPDIKISGKKLKITITNSSGIFELSRLFFTLNHKSDETKITTKGILKTTISNSELLTGSVKFSVSGSVNDSFEISNSIFNFKSIENNFFTSDQLSFQGSYKSGIFQLQKIEDSRPLDVRLSYFKENKILNINFNSEKFIPLDYFKPGNIDESILQWLGTSVTGTGELSYSLETKDLFYSVQTTAYTNNKLIPYQAEIITSLTGDSFKVDFSNLKVKTQIGSMAFYGSVLYKNLLPSGKLFLYYNNSLAKMSAELKLSSKNNELEIIGNNIEINEINIFNFNTNIIFFDNDMDLKTSMDFDQNNDLTSKQLKIDANIQYKPDFFLNLSLSTKNMPLNSILSMISSKYSKYLKNLPEFYIDTDIFISTDLKRFSFSGPNIKMFSNDGIEVSFSSFGNNETIEINQISTTLGDKTLQGSVKTILNKRSVSSKIDLVYNENPYNISLFYYPEKGVYFDGNYDLSGSLYKSGNIYEFNLNFKDFPIPVKDNTGKITIQTNGFYESYNNWQANFERLEYFNIPGLIPGNTANIIGTVTEKDIHLSNITYTDSLSSLFGSGQFSYNLFQDKEISGDFVLNSLENEEYKGTILIRDQKIDFNAGFVKAPLSRFEKIPVSGLLNGNLKLQGLLPIPNIEMTIQLEKGEFNSSPLEIETSLDITENKMNISYFRLKYVNQVIQKGNGGFDLKTGDFFLKAEYLGALRNENFQTLIDISGKSELLFEKPSINEILKSDFTSTFIFDNIIVNQLPKNSWHLYLNQSNQQISFNGGPEDGLTGFINNLGNFSVVSKTGLPIRGEAEGILTDDIVDIKIKNIEMDLKILNLIPYDDILEFTNGTAYGSLNISGQKNDPVFNGSLNVKGAEVNVFMLPDEITPFNTKIVFKDRSITIGPKEIQVNDSYTKISMELLLGKWIPVSYNIDISTLNEDQIHIIYDVTTVGLGIDGFVSGNIIISQDENGLHILSDLTADDSIINLGSVNSDKKNDTNQITINMKFTTGKKVQFIWPSTAIPILRATADSGQSIYLTMDNFNGSYSLIGDVNIKYGEIYYFQKSFYLSEGLIGFDENETKFDPILGFKAQIKEVDAAGEIVNISLIQDNVPISRFEPRFESDPPLSDVEIFSILGAGVFTQIGNEQIDLTSAILLTGDLVTKFAIIRNFEKKVKDIFNLDLFSIRTQMIQNILIDRFITNDTVEQEVYLDSFGRYLDNTTLYLGKYIGDDIFIQALLQINNQSFLDENLYTASKLLVESTISLEWDTPLFLLGFSVKPDFVDPVASIQNTSLELSWGYSY